MTMGPRSRPLRVSVVPIQDGRSDLMCIACGQFRTQFSVVIPGKSPMVGMHVRCWQEVATSRREERQAKRKAKASRDDPKLAEARARLETITASRRAAAREKASRELEEHLNEQKSPPPGAKGDDE